jgi:hypothetical protein
MDNICADVSREAIAKTIVDNLSAVFVDLITRLLP